MKLTVIGAGSWGSALTQLASRNEHEIMLWAHDPEVARTINEDRANPKHLPDAVFADNVTATPDLVEAATFSDTIMMVTPSHHYRRVLSEISAASTEPVRIISGTKGIENDSLERVSEITRSVLGEQLKAFSVLSGPTFAREVCAGTPSAAVAASSSQEFASEIQSELSDPTFRIYRSSDVAGVEIGGSMKNVIAIAAGVLEGLGLGHNTMAALVTRGLAEMKRLGKAIGAKPATFSGLAGIGDLLLTCTGNLSRNRRVGTRLGRGETLDDILNEQIYVAEGVRTTRSAKMLAQREGVDMPITAEMYRVIYEREDPAAAIRRLMTRSLKHED